MSVDLRVDWCDAKAARWACRNWHYSKTLPANKSNYIGAWEDGNFIGVVVFGLGASPSLGKPYGLENFQFAELTRIALKEHKSYVSMIATKAIKMVRSKNPGLRILISFADAFHGHNGSIYQSMNWIFTGTTQPATMLDIDGELIDPRRFNGHGHNAKKIVPPSAVVIKTPGKYRYLYPLDRAMRRQILPLAQPYPKRETCEQSIKGDTFDIQSEGAGSIPAVRFLDTLKGGA